MGKSQVARDGLSSFHHRIDLEAFGPSRFFGRRKKRLDPADFVEVCDGFTAVDVCHYSCAKQLISILSLSWDLPKEVWDTRSIRIVQSGGVPLKLDLHCVICDSEKPGWEYEPKKDA